MERHPLHFVRYPKRPDLLRSLFNLSSNKILSLINCSDIINGIGQNLHYTCFRIVNLLSVIFKSYQGTDIFKVP